VRTETLKSKELQKLNPEFMNYHELELNLDRGLKIGGETAKSLLECKAKVPTMSWIISRPLKRNGNATLR